MAKASASSPPASSPALKRATPNTQNMRSQKSILGFFQKSSPATPSANRTREPASSPAQRAAEQRGGSAAKPTPKDQKRSFSSFAQDLSPVPSSDIPVPDDEEESGNGVKVSSREVYCLSASLTLLFRLPRWKNKTPTCRLHVE
jgi:DNA mismatch repair protein MSH6